MDVVRVELWDSDTISDDLIGWCVMGLCVRARRRSVRVYATT